MAANTHAILTLLILSALAIASPATGLGGSGPLVGGRTKISDVETNKEIQQLGKYSVTEYNRQQHENRNRDGGESSGDLEFVKVVAAEKQVVAGIKYYLKIVAAKGGNKKTFDAEVVVQAWKKSKQLTSFAPSHN